MAILTLNAGSSSLKFAVFSRDGRERRLSGHVDGVGRDAAQLSLRREGREDETRTLKRGGSHEGALEAALEIAGEASGETVHAVGHRIVHGGAEFSRPALITDDVEAELERLVPLAPLHQPHNLKAVRTARRAFPDAAQIACFDTAFHRSHPFTADAFALPRRYYDQGVRRYGFHGLSYEYLTARLAELEGGTPGRAVLAHLGSGASLCAVKDGVSCDTSMGFSALDGLPMATRCGQIDPGVLLHLMSKEGLGAEALTRLLYKESGLKGLSGTSGDMREVESAGTKAASEAFDYFVHRCRREIAGLCASLEGLDALVFSAGVGEHSPGVRAAVCEGLAWLGVGLDPRANQAAQGEDALISAETSSVRVWMIPTDEERVIAEAAAGFV
ncbi:MAG: acetate/propionate family kinase [Oceanicaulis sp.]